MQIVWADTETTGFRDHDLMVELAAATYTDGYLRTFQTYIKYPLYPDGFHQAFEVNGLSVEQLDDEGVEPREAYEKFVEWLKMYTPVMNRNEHIFLGGHNIMFDVKYIKKFMTDWFLHESRDELFHKVFARPVVDSMTTYAMGMMQNCVPSASSFRLSNLCNKMDIKVEKFHSAIDDAVASMKLHEAVVKNMTVGKEQLTFGV